jgi:multiple sugar transport system permease protein
MIFNGFRDPADPFFNGIFPSQYSLINFQKVISNQETVRAFKNSFIVSFFAAAFSLIIGSLAAYGFSRFKFRGADTFRVFIIIIRLFPGVLLALALFHLAGVLGVYNTFIPLIILNGMLNLPFTIRIMDTMFTSIPIELEEAAWMDGASRLKSIVKIILPLISPGLAATGAFVFLLSWNEYLFAVSFIRSSEKMLITTAIAANIGQYTVDFTGLIATGMLASVPLLIVFLIIQRYIVTGLTAGALKQ